MERKSDQVRRLVAGRRYKEALQIAKDFRYGISLEERKAMQLAYESMIHDRFYLSLGVDVDAAIQKGIDVVINIYGKGKKADAEDLYQ